MTALALAGCVGDGDDDETNDENMDDEGSMDDENMDDEGSMGDENMDDEGSMGDENMDDDDMDDEGSMGDENMDDDEMDDDDMDDDMSMSPMDPEEAPRASVDRFSEEAGTLMVRSEENDLPGPDERIDFDHGPFITQGLGPDGNVVEYYNFDVQPVDPAPIYALFYENGDPVEDQLNIIDVIPGDDGYNDFWQVHRVTVPEEYEANTLTSAHQILDGDYAVEATDTIKNCPVVPDGSTASQRYGDGDADLVEGWYDEQVVSYFLFEEDDLEVSAGRFRCRLST